MSTTTRTEHPVLLRRRSSLQLRHVLPSERTDRSAPDYEKTIRLPDRRPKPKFRSLSSVFRTVTGEAKLEDDQKPRAHSPNRFLTRADEELTEESAEQVLQELESSRDRGLTDEEAQIRLIEVGRNELAGKPPLSFWRLLFGQLTDLLVLLLIGASLGAFALGEYAAGSVIVIIVIANALLGVMQELRADAAVDALSKATPEFVDVKRSGNKKQIPVSTLVPGDVVLLETGMVIPADLRLVVSKNLVVSEAPLTGEAEGIKKDADWVKPESPLPRTNPPTVEVLIQENQRMTNREHKDENESKHEEKIQVDANTQDKQMTKNMVFMGCQVVEGRGEGVVVRTGMATQMGVIQHLMNTADEHQSPLQQKLNVLGRGLGVASLCISVVVLIIGLVTGRGIHDDGSVPKALQMVLIAISLTVAAVPEGLPACVTITLALGMKAMAKRNVLVRQLHAVETLGAASIICSDKTGTLTAGKMTAVRVWANDRLLRLTGVGYTPVGLMVPASCVSDHPNELSYQADRLASGTTPSPEGSHAPDPEFGALVCSKVGLLLGMLCSNADLSPESKGNGEEWKVTGNSTDRAVVVAAWKMGFNAPTAGRFFKRVQENPFSSSRKMMSVVIQLTDKHNEHEHENPLYLIHKDALQWFRTQQARPDALFSVVKGAPNVVLNVCSSFLLYEHECEEHCTTCLRDCGIRSNLHSRLMTEEKRQELLKQVDLLSQQAFRVLAVAFRSLHKPRCRGVAHPSPESSKISCVAEGETDLTFSALMAMIDPERPGVRESIAKAKAAGVRVVMITGDYLLTASAIAKRIGLIDSFTDEKKPTEKQTEEEQKGLVRDTKNVEAVDCSEVRGLSAQRDALEQAEAMETSSETRRALSREREKLTGALDELTSRVNVYARAKPEDKITIVRSLQRQGHVCAMTGDGVNDAPALKQADIGVAMGITGTAVSKSAAKIVLADDNFVSIVSAIEEGRTIYNNITKFVFYLLSTNVAEVFFILVCVSLGLPTPLSPIHLLWMNILTDGAPALALAVEPAEPGVMSVKPRRLSERLVHAQMLVLILLNALILTVSCLVVYAVGLQWHCAPDFDIDTWSPSQPVDISNDNEGLIRARTMSIVFIVLAELLRGYTSRSLSDSLFHQGIWTNRWMQLSTAVAVVLCVSVVNIPVLQSTIFQTTFLDGRSWVLILLAAFVPAAFDEVFKALARRRRPARL